MVSLPLYRQLLSEPLTMKAVWFGDETSKPPLSQFIGSAALTLAACPLIH